MGVPLVTEEAVKFAAKRMRIANIDKEVQSKTKRRTPG